MKASRFYPTPTSACLALSLAVTLETSTSMAPGVWLPVTTDIPLAATWSYTHPAGLATGPRRFYRAWHTAP